MNFNLKIIIINFKIKKKIGIRLINLYYYSNKKLRKQREVKI